MLNGVVAKRGRGGIGMCAEEIYVELSLWVKCFVWDEKGKEGIGKCRFMHCLKQCC